MTGFQATILLVGAVAVLGLLLYLMDGWRHRDVPPPDHTPFDPPR